MADVIMIGCDGYGEPCPSRFISDLTAGKARKEAAVKGWTYRYGVDLCPDCARKRHEGEPADN